MLTIERAISDCLDPASLRLVAEWNERSKIGRLQRQAENLHRIADKMELLGFGRGVERSAA